LWRIVISFVGEPISGCSGDSSGIKVVVRQLEPVFPLRQEQRSIVVQGFVEAVHIQLFNGRCGRMKREAAEWANFWHHAQKECLEASEEARLFIDAAPLLAVPRI